MMSKQVDRHSWFGNGCLLGYASTPAIERGLA
jgi:hypothetical protein